MVGMETGAIKLLKDVLDGPSVRVKTARVELNDDFEIRMTAFQQRFHPLKDIRFGSFDIDFYQASAPRFGQSEDIAQRSGSDLAFQLAKFSGRATFDGR